jgi:hypothetical protein
VPGWVVADAFFGDHLPKWDVAVGVKNIMHAEYFVTANGSGGFVRDPRTYYLKGSYKF